MFEQCRNEDFNPKIEKEEEQQQEEEEERNFISPYSIFQNHSWIKLFVTHTQKKGKLNSFGNLKEIKAF